MNSPAYHPTESKYKGGADEMYVTYELAQATRGRNSAVYPKVKRVYIAGEVREWKTGDFEKRTGRRVHGVRIDYEQERSSYRRRSGTPVRRGTQLFTQVVEVPERARDIHFYRAHGDLPPRYREALQRIR